MSLMILNETIRSLEFLANFSNNKKTKLMEKDFGLLEKNNFIRLRTLSVDEIFLRNDGNKVKHPSRE